MNGLVGKLFHTFEGGKMYQRGSVLAEPGKGIFLVELSSWTHSEGEDYKHHQVLRRIEDMLDWTFFDSEKDADALFEAYVGDNGCEWMRDADFYFERG